MTREDRKREVERIKGDANTAKEKLMRLVDELIEAGAVREAVRLEKIVERLEIWQNTDPS